MAKNAKTQSQEVVREGYKKVGGFEAEFFNFKKAGEEFSGSYLETKTVEKSTKFAKKKQEVKRFFFEDENGKKWQIDNMGNLGYLIEQAQLQEGDEVLIVYNGKKKSNKDKKEYHNFDLFIKE